MGDNLLNEVLYSQTRLQVLTSGVIAPQLMNDAYIYAWDVGLYPYFDDTDYSIPSLPHELFKEQFLVKQDKVEKVINYLDDKWLINNSPTFYELEDAFGGKSYRCQLLHICRYAYLNGSFDDTLWDALLTPMQHPTEAKSITRNYCRDDISL